MLLGKSIRASPIVIMSCRFFKGRPLLSFFSSFKLKLSIQSSPFFNETSNHETENTR